MFLSIGMLKLNYFLADIFILSAEKQPIKLSWRKIECLREKRGKTVKQHSPANTIETKKRELNMLSSTQHLIQVDKALYLLKTVSGLRELGI